MRILAWLMTILLTGTLSAAPVWQEQEKPEEKKQEEKKEEKKDEKKPQPSSTQFGVPQGQTQFGGSGSRPRFGAAPGQQIPQEQLLALRDLMQAPNPDTRLTLAEDFLAKFPESLIRHRAYAVAAEAYRMQNNFEKTVEFGERTLELAPNDALTMFIMADALAEGAVPMSQGFKEKLARAEELALQGLEILPELFAAVPRSEQVTEEEQELDRRLIESQPHATLGYVYFRQNNFARAVEELKLSTELNEKSPNAVDFLRLGLAHARKFNWAEAKAALERCIELGGPAADTAERRLKRVNVMLERQSEK